MLICCTDQKCSRFIQDRLKSNGLSLQERCEFLENMLCDPRVDFHHLVLDSFGNYIIQRILLLPQLESRYKDMLYEKVRGKVLLYSTHKHGCRVM